MSTRKVVRGKSDKGGFALLEALVSAGILSTVLAGAIGALLISTQSASTNGARVEAAYLADEGIEAVRILRDNGWGANIAGHAPSEAFYLEWDGATWVATTTNSLIDNIFERSIELADVYRNGSEQIAENGSLDSDTKLITVTVSWQSSDATSSRTLSAYITNLFDN